MFVTSSTSTHREVVIAAAEAGKSIFCEKPIALTLEDTDRMIDALDRTGTMFQAGFMRRFDAGYMAAKKQIEAGIIGKPVTFKSIGRDPFCPDLEYARPSVSGGLILDMAIHDFDLGRWLMADEVKRVYTEGGTLAFPQLNMWATLTMRWSTCSSRAAGWATWRSAATRCTATTSAPRSLALRVG